MRVLAGQDTLRRTLHRVHVSRFVFPEFLWHQRLVCLSVVRESPEPNSPPEHFRWHCMLSIVGPGISLSRGEKQNQEQLIILFELLKQKQKKIWVLTGGGSCEGGRGWELSIE